jgi:hypothetical protein
MIIHSTPVTPVLTLALVTALSFAAASATAAQSFGPTLTHPNSPAKSTQADGFLQRWLILEPIRVNGLTESAVRSTVRTDYFPNQLSVIPADGDTVTFGGTNLTWHTVETANYNVNLFHFARALQKPTSDVLFWAVTIVTSPEEMHSVRLAIGSNAASVWWVNGQEAIGIYGDRQTVIDDGVSKRLTLQKGTNVVRCAVINGGGATDFCARFLDAEDRPITRLTVRMGASGK